MNSTPDTPCHSMCEQSKLKPAALAKPAASTAARYSPALAMSPIARSLGWHSRSIRRAVFQAGLEDRREPLDQQFEADFVHVGNRVPAQRLRAAAETKTNGSSNGPANRQSPRPARRDPASSDEMRQAHQVDQRFGSPACGRSRRRQLARKTDRSAAGCCRPAPA